LHHHHFTYLNIQIELKIENYLDIDIVIYFILSPVAQIIQKIVTALKELLKFEKVSESVLHFVLETWKTK
jgi:hypothetical protein